MESVSKDIRSRAVLDEWLRLGVAILDEDDRVRLNVHAFVPREGAEEKLFYLGHNLHDHIAAAGSNVQGHVPPLLDRVVHYDALSSASVERLKALAESRGMRALKEINEEAMRLERQDASLHGPRQRITFGVYFFHAPSEDAASGDDSR